MSNLCNGVDSESMNIFEKYRVEVSEKRKRSRQMTQTSASA